MHVTTSLASYVLSDMTSPLRRQRTLILWRRFLLWFPVARSLSPSRRYTVDAGSSGPASSYEWLLEAVAAPNND